MKDIYLGIAPASQKDLVELASQERSFTQHLGTEVKVNTLSGMRILKDGRDAVKAAFRKSFRLALKENGSLSREQWQYYKSFKE